MGDVQAEMASSIGIEESVLNKVMKNFENDLREAGLLEKVVQDLASKYGLKRDNM